MRVSIETAKLAIEKGYKKCTCSLGGYPSCICTMSKYTPITSTELHDWLRTKNIFVSYMVVLTPDIEFKFYSGIVKEVEEKGSLIKKYEVLYNPVVKEGKEIKSMLYFKDFEEGLETAIVETLKLI